MIYVFGHKAKTLGNETLLAPCPHCNHGTQTLWAFARYFHIWYIPFFPFERLLVLECAGCKKITKKGEWHDSLRNQIETKRRTFRFPLSLFSGLFLVAGVIGFSAWRSHERSMQTSALLSTPHVGDVIVVYQKNDNKVGYWPALIEKVTEDAVIVRPANYRYPTERGLEEHLTEDMKKRDDFFSETILAYPRAEMTPELVKRVVRTDTVN